MKIYFPQWQGSGDGISIRHGAKTILEHLNDESISKVPLSPIPSGKEGNQEYPINNFNAILDQLSGLKDVIIRERPDQIQIIGNTEELKDLTIFDALGQDVTNSIEINASDGNELIVNLIRLPIGIYFLKTQSKVNKFYKSY